MESEIEYPLCFGSLSPRQLRRITSLSLSAWRLFQHRSRSFPLLSANFSLVTTAVQSKASIASRSAVEGRRAVASAPPAPPPDFFIGKFPRGSSTFLQNSLFFSSFADRQNRGSTHDNCTARFHSEYRSSNSNTVTEKLVAHHARSKLKLF